uniref:Uncharacterized protein n=1 Tax=Kalanchoe fedtschenkoi TaxID=63787 RepID=A0A7N0TYR8_KALFE
MLDYNPCSLQLVQYKKLWLPTWALLPYLDCKSSQESMQNILKDAEISDSVPAWLWKNQAICNEVKKMLLRK